MAFSEKEQKLLDLIIAKNGITVKNIEAELGKQAVGGLGKLIQAEKVEKRKVKMGEGYGMKMVTCYFIKEEPKEEKNVQE